MAEASYYHAIKKAAFEKGIILPKRVAKTGDEAITNLVLRPALDSELRMKLLKAMEDIKFTRLSVKIVDQNIGNKLNRHNNCTRICCE